MAFDSVQLPTVSSAGQAMASRKVTGGGPAGSDVYTEVDAVQPDNGVGRTLLEVPLGPVPASPTAISAEDCAADHLLLVNTTNAPVSVALTAGAVELLPTGYQLGARTIVNLPLNGIKLLGPILWSAGAGVNGAFRGFVAP